MTSTELVHVPRTAVVYAQTGIGARVYRAYNRVRRSFVDLMNGDPQIVAGALKLLARYQYKARHRRKLTEPQEQARRVRDTTGRIIEETRTVIPPKMTLRQRMHSNRLRRRTYAPAIKCQTGALPIIKRETAEQWERRQRNTINNSQLVLSGAEGPLAR